MKAILWKLHSRSMSGKKSQMMIVDSIISYLLFSFFLFYTSSMIIDIMQPFSKSINNDIIYKNSESLSTVFYKEDISAKDLLGFCNYSKGEINSVRSDYEIKSISMPYYDESVNESAQGIHLERSKNELLIIFNTGSSQNFDLIIFSKSQINFENKTYSEYSTFNKTDEDNFVLIKIFSNSTTSAQKYELTVNDTATILFETYDYSNIFVGKTLYQFSCGDFKVLEQKRKLSVIANLENKKILVNYNVEAYFE